MSAQPSQARLAGIFAARISASHGLTLYLTWLAFTRGSAALGGTVLAVRAVISFCVPLLIGRLHDRERIVPWLRMAAVVEAAAAVTTVWLRSSETGPGWMTLVLTAALGATSGLFDTAMYPMLLAARPGRLQTHVLVGLAFDVAKIAASSLVLALLAAWDSPIPVMLVCSLSLAGWRLASAGTAPASVPNSGPADAGRAGTPERGAAAAVVALSAIALLPGQLIAYQTLLADGSFRRYAVLGTVFAFGAVLGNLTLQRTPVALTSIAGAYLITGVGLLLALAAPTIGIFLYGAGTAGYYQLTRALVVGKAAPERRGQAAGRLAAATKLAAVAGAAGAAAVIGQPRLMVLLGVGICVSAAALVGMPRFAQRDTRRLQTASAQQS